MGFSRIDTTTENAKQIRTLSSSAPGLSAGTWIQAAATVLLEAHDSQPNPSERQLRVATNQRVKSWKMTSRLPRHSVAFESDPPRLVKGREDREVS
jgi:hypothetical protein